MSWTVLSVAYPFAPVGEDAVGGAEQVLTMLDRALVEAGHRSIVIAPQGSTVRGELVPLPAVPESIDDHAREAVHRTTRELIDRVLRAQRVDLIHLHGIDFADYLPGPGVPVLATLHLPLAWYPESIFRKRASADVSAVRFGFAATDGAGRGRLVSRDRERREPGNVSAPGAEAKLRDGAGPDLSREGN